MIQMNVRDIHDRCHDRGNNSNCVEFQCAHVPSEIRNGINIYKSPLHPLSATEQKGEYIAKLCDMSKFHVVHQCVRKLYQNNNSQIYIIQERQIRKRNK